MATKTKSEAAKAAADTLDDLYKIEGVYKRLEQRGLPCFANDNISKGLKKGDVEAIQRQVERHFQCILHSLVIDPADHNTKETAKRYAKMFVREVMAGRYEEPPKVTDFPNTKNSDSLYTVGPITVRSMCSHHMVPIMGQCWIGTIAAERLIGLSKFNRLVYHVARRPQIQEEMTEQIADAIVKAVAPRGVVVVVKATHYCGCWRGVEDSSEMITSVVRGLARDEPAVKSEFFRLIGM